MTEKINSHVKFVLVMLHWFIQKWFAKGELIEKKKCSERALPRQIFVEINHRQDIGPVNLFWFTKSNFFFLAAYTTHLLYRIHGYVRDKKFCA